MKRKVIIIIGPPGSGKGTQASLLSEKLNLYYLETSKILEEKFRQAKEGDFVEVDGKKFFISQEKKLFETGFLCSPPFVTYLIKEKIKELFHQGKNLVMAGSPRTLYEGKEVIPLLKELYGPENIDIILINLSEEESIFRNAHRRLCSLMRHPILYNEETKNLTRCPLDGSKLIVRVLDNEEVMKVRIKEYKERTLPLIDYFKEEGLQVNEVEGKQTPAELHEDILKVLKISNDSH
ncbi:nucleoside monophosphate kinase [bacterium]|nr:nucleoside monophosphate kinase [bacterium]